MVGNEYRNLKKPLGGILTVSLKIRKEAWMPIQYCAKARKRHKRYRIGKEGKIMSQGDRIV